MKKTKTILLILLLILSTVLLSCNKKDDSPSDSDPNAGADHTYELKFVGGKHDGQTLSGSIPNDSSSAASYLDEPPFQSIVVGLVDNVKKRDIIMVIKRQSVDATVEIKEEIEDNETGAGIAFYTQDGSEMYAGKNGTLTISNFKSIPLFPNGGSASLTVNFTGQFSESPSEETVQITGKMTMNPLRP